MSTKIPLGLAVALGICLAAFGCTDQTAGVRIDFVGNQPPQSVRTTDGKCSAVEVGIPGELWYVECGVKVGLQRFVASCTNANLPEPMLELNVPEGDSHYIQFAGACDSTPAQIIKGNSASRGKWIWSVGA